MLLFESYVWRDGQISTRYPLGHGDDSWTQFSFKLRIRMHVSGTSTKPLEKN